MDDKVKLSFVAPANSEERIQRISRFKVSLTMLPQNGEHVVAFQGSEAVALDGDSFVDMMFEAASFVDKNPTNALKTLPAKMTKVMQQMLLTKVAFFEDEIDVDVDLGESSILRMTRDLTLEVGESNPEKAN